MVFSILLIKAVEFINTYSQTIIDNRVSKDLDHDVVIHAGEPTIGRVDSGDSCSLGRMWNAGMVSLMMEGYFLCCGVR